MEDIIYYVILAIGVTIPSTVKVFIICLKCCQRKPVEEKRKKKVKKSRDRTPHHNINIGFEISEAGASTRSLYEDVIEYSGRPDVLANACFPNSGIQPDSFTSGRQFIEAPGIAEGIDPTDVRIIDIVPHDYRPRPYAPPAPPDPPNLPI